LLVSITDRISRGAMSKPIERSLPKTKKSNSEGRYIERQLMAVKAPSMVAIVIVRPTKTDRSNTRCIHYLFLSSLISGYSFQAHYSLLNSSSFAVRRLDEGSRFCRHAEFGAAGHREAL